jgi:hypothetical protein
MSIHKELEKLIEEEETNSGLGKNRRKSPRYWLTRAFLSGLKSGDKETL